MSYWWWTNSYRSWVSLCLFHLNISEIGIFSFYSLGQINSIICCIWLYLIWDWSDCGCQIKISISNPGTSRVHNANTPRLILHRQYVFGFIASVAGLLDALPWQPDTRNSKSWNIAWESTIILTVNDMDVNGMCGHTYYNVGLIYIHWPWPIKVIEGHSHRNVQGQMLDFTDFWLIFTPRVEFDRGYNTALAVTSKGHFPSVRVNFPAVCLHTQT